MIMVTGVRGLPLHKYGPCSPAREISNKEGWVLLDTEGYNGHNAGTIQMNGGGTSFKTHEEARAYVAARAAKGSKFHITAWNVHCTAVLMGARLRTGDNYGGKIE